MMKVLQVDHYQFDNIDYMMIRSGIRNGNSHEQIQWLNNIRSILQVYKHNPYNWSLFIKGLDQNRVIWIIEEIYKDADNDVFNIILDILDMIQSDRDSY